MGCTASAEAQPPDLHRVSAPREKAAPSFDKNVPGATHDAASKAVPKLTGNGDNPNQSAQAEAKSHGSNESTAPQSRSRASSTAEDNSDEGSRSSSKGSSSNLARSKPSNPKLLPHSQSAIGLDEMIEDRREIGDLRQNVVHIEVPFGKPIEEVYDGVHNGPVLGSGISGLVRLVTHKATGLKYAVKVLDLALVDNSEGLIQLREEIFIMCQLDHPNIVRLEEVYESESEIYLVQELCHGGELFDRLDEQPDYHYTEAECARLVKQMLCAVRYLHSKGIIHRDLKLENFLFSTTESNSELKMIDFGLSKHFRLGEVQHEAVGTPYTVAPEVIHGTYDERCDIWAIGVITFLLLSGDPPFGGCGGPEPLMTVRSNILRGHFSFEPEDIWDLVSQTAKDFISSLLVTEPSLRPTAWEIQKSTWLVEWANKDLKQEDNVLNPNVVKALVNFKEFSDMRKLLCEVLSFTLLPYQIKELRAEFEKMDTDGSGEISFAALKQVLMSNAGAGSLGALTEDEVTDIFDAMRVRKSETRIHWHEFIAAGISQCQVDDRNLRLAFDRLDSNHKGYITLDDIMDLMGSDAIQSEDDMIRMWGDSIKAVKCTNARITYGDFLLLMKGQTKENPAVNSPVQLEGIISMVHKLPPLMEVESTLSGETSPVLPEKPSVELPSDEMVGVEGALTIEDDLEGTLNDSSHTPLRPNFGGVSGLKSAPATPADHKKILDVEFVDSPLSMDDDQDILSSGPGVPGSSASLTPPASPVRGPKDYITPSAGRNIVEPVSGNVNALSLPGIITKPAPYTRRRSRSVGDEDSADMQRDFQEIAGVVRDMMLPETDHIHNQKLQKTLGASVKDGTKSNLKVNRQLYRAHRQMRLAVLDASKRFEEQQAMHTREMLVEQRRKEEEMSMIQAGLVMRHGNKKQVSSDAIRAAMQENQAKQRALVEKANRRGGRGRRSRKKTISDMSGMMSSMGQDELSKVTSKAIESPALKESKSSDPDQPVDAAETEPPELPDLSKGQIRGATVPGDFRKTSDPFSRGGKYGAFANWVNPN